MTKSQVERFLIVQLSVYAGNVDEFVCAALTGHGSEHRRHGYEEGRALFESLYTPLERGEAEEYDEEAAILHPDNFVFFQTEYGRMPYEVDFPNSNGLRLKFDDYVTDDMIRAVVDLWRERIPSMTLVTPDVAPQPGSRRSPSLFRVGVVGFKLETHRTVVEEISLDL